MLPNRAASPGARRTEEHELPRWSLASLKSHPTRWKTKLPVALRLYQRRTKGTVSALVFVQKRESFLVEGRVGLSATLRVARSSDHRARSPASGSVLRAFRSLDQRRLPEPNYLPRAGIVASRGKRIRQALRPRAKLSGTWESIAPGAQGRERGKRFRTLS